MSIVKLGSKYYDEWNQFCLENKWFWHTTHWLEYIKNSKFNTEFINRSFFIEKNNKIINIVPLLQENDRLISPGIDDKKEILQEIKNIALENGIKYIQVNSDVKNYLNIFKYTCILDLYDIKITKGHKSAIKKAEKYLDFEIVSETHQFMKDYFEIAGKITRPEKTFKILEEWIKQGFGILLKAKYKNMTAGYIYILKYCNKAYYFMSATYPDFKKYNVSHYLQSVAFDILRNQLVRYYELGDQVFNSLHEQPTEKEKNISKFKRGFGGEIIVNPSSEYFFCPKYMEETYQKRIKNYLRSEYE